jgi:Flp pilus assembly pilin Flp
VDLAEQLVELIGSTQFVRQDRPEAIPRGRFRLVCFIGPTIPVASDRAKEVGVYSVYTVKSCAPIPDDENIMRNLSKLFRAAMLNEQGGEVIEYALVLGLIIVAAIAIITAVGTKVVGKWTSVNNSLN